MLSGSTDDEPPADVSLLATTTKLSGPISMAAGQSLSFSATVTSGTTAVNAGTVTFLDGTTVLGTGTVGAAGVATFVAKGLAIGPHAITASYGGNSTYDMSTSSSLAVTIGKASDNVMLSWSTPLANQSLTINAQVGGALFNGAARTGTLTLAEGTTTLATVDIATATPGASGYFALTVPAGLSLGAHTLKVSYSGDATYATSSSTLNLNLNNVSLAVSYSSAAMVGQNFTVNAALNGPLVNGAARTGTISLVEGTTTLASINLASATANTSGYYALTVAGGLPLGSHTLKVVYSGDTNYSTLTTNLATINSTNVSLGLSFAGSALIGQPYTVNATLNGALVNNTPRTGTLSLVEGTTTLASVDVAAAQTTANGAFALTVPAGFAAGSHTLRVVYTGDATYSSLASTIIVTAGTTLSTSLGLSYSTSANVGQPYTVNVSVNGPLAANLPRTGTLSLVEGTTTLASVDLATATATASGYYALTVASGLTAGPHTLKAVYSGDATYTSSTANLATVTATVKLAVSNVLISWATPLANQPLTVNAQLSGALSNSTPRTGTLSLIEGTTTLASIDITTATPNASGYFALSVPGGLSIGAHALKIVYSGDSVYAIATTNLNLNLANDSLALSYSTAAMLGVNYTVNAAINGALVNGAARTGTLSLVEGTTTLASVNVTTVTPSATGYYALTVTGGLPVGTHTLKVVYTGDASYSALTSNLATVTSANDGLSLSYSNATLIGQPYSLNAAITGTLVGGAARTGTLSLMEGNNTLASIDVAATTPTNSGFYTLSIPAGFTAGSHTLKVVYSGDGVYTPVSATVVVTAGTTLPTSLAASYTTAATAGQPYTVNVSINGTLAANAPRSGTLSLVENGATLASVDLATATPTANNYYALTVVGGLPAGTHSLKVVYSGDTTYVGSTSTLATVTSSVKLATTSVSLSWATPLANQALTVNALVSGALVNGTPRTGTLTLMEGTTTLAAVNIATATPNASGFFALSVPGGLPLGSHTLKVVYSGDSVYATSTSSFALNLSNVTVGLSYSSQATLGQNFTVNASLNGALVNGAARTGTLSLVEGTTTLASVDIATATPNASGQYALTVTGGMPAGTHSLKVVYSGDANYSAVTTNLATITSANVSLGLNFIGSTLVGQSFTLKAALNGTLVNSTPRTGTLSLIEGNNTLATVDVAAVTPDASGYYALSVPAGFAAGVHTVKVAYSGDAIYTPVSLNVGITAGTTLPTTLSASYSTSASVGQAYTANVAINGALGTNLPRAGTLSLVEGTTTLASVDISAVTPSATGYYALTIAGGLPAGNHTLKAVYSGDSTYLTSSFTLATINSSSKLATTSVFTSYSLPLANLPLTINAQVSGTLVTGTPRTGTLSLVEGTMTLASIDITTATAGASGYFALSVPAGLPAGSHTLKVVYSGDAIYAGSSTTLTLNLTNVSLAVSYSTVALTGQPYNVSAALNGALIGGAARTGTLSLMEGTTTLASVDIAATAPNSSGYYSFGVAGGLTSGTHTLRVVYSGDVNYSSVTYSMATVTAANTNLSLSWSTPLANTAFTISAAINGGLISGAPRTGTLSLMEGTTTLASVDLATATPNASGYYALAVASGLPVGSHTLKVVYSGDANYNSANSTLAWNLLNDALSVSYSNATLIGQSYSVSAAITGALLNGAARTGTLSLVEGTTTLASVDVSTATPNASGQYALTVVAGLAAGPHTLKVVYSGDAAYSAVTTFLATVNSGTTLPTTLSPSYTTSATVGLAYTVSAAINGTLATGVPRTGTLSLVEAATTLASIDIATTTPSNTGFYALTLPGGLAAGTHSLKVVYSGDSTYVGSTFTLATVTSSVKLISTSVGLSYSTPVANQPLTINAIINGSLVTGTPRTGTLSLVEGSNTLASVDITTATPNASGYYALSVPAGLALGSHSLKVVYSGDTVYAGYTSSLTLNITNVTLGLSYSTTPVTGLAYTVNAALNGTLVNGAARTGTLSLVEGTTTLASVDVGATMPGTNGYYPLTVAGGLTAGTHTLKVVYSGDANYSAVTANLATITAANSTLTLSYALPLANQPLAINAAINGALVGGTPRTGMITLVEGTNTLATVDVATATPNAQGYYTLSVPGGLPVGSHTLKVVYSGDAIYNSFTSTLSFSLSNTSLSLQYSTAAMVGNAFNVNAAINGAVIPGSPRTGTLSLVEGTTTLASVNVATTTPNAQGYYALNVPAGLTLGTHSLKVVYTGDANYSTVTTFMATVTTTNDSLALSYSSSALIGQPYSLSAAINGALVNGAARTGTLSIVEGTTTLTSINVATATPNAQGYYALALASGLTAGSHTLKVSYSGDANYSAVSSTIVVSSNATLPTSLSFSNFTAVATEGQPYSVNALINGTLATGVARTGTLSLMEGTTVLATIDLATATPNAQGFFTITIAAGLPAGTHTIKLVYSGDSHYAGSTINLPTITSAAPAGNNANDLALLSLT